MFKRKDKAINDQLNQYLAKEVLNSEILRTRVMFWIFLVGMVSFLALLLIDQDILPEILRGNNSILPLTFIVIFTVYEGFVIQYLKREKQEGKDLPSIFQYFSAFEETSLITLGLFMTLFIAGQDNPDVLITPIPFMYFVFIAISALRLNFWVSLITGLFAGIGYFIFIYTALNYFIDPVPGSLLTSYIAYLERAIIMVVTGLVTGLVTRQIRAQIVNSFQAAQEREEIVNLFGQHVSPEVVDRLLQQGTERLSEFRNVCVMFLDIRDYTKFSSGKKPADVVNYLNTMFSFMIDIVNEHHGIINKFLGDGFMAVFGAPISDGSEIENAVKAGYALIDAVNEACKAGTIENTRIGIGLHAGEAITGDIGSARRKEYTVIGDVVNMAARIEGLNKRFTSQFLVSKKVLDGVSGNSFQAESMGEVDIRGVAVPVEIYKLS